mmetsp:Transcript_36403/g.69868  ORF Transcript_36403/g.69868 Transcript_36403/m.69868 type:complete len:85 (-) Transcript_36403:1852-2106(-)
MKRLYNADATHMKVYLCMVIANLLVSSWAGCDPTNHESHSHGGAELARQLTFPWNFTDRSALHCHYCPAHHRNNHHGFRVLNKC